ncbi:MAG: hypothetical protein JST33_03640 [Actinobacteria bacterium]|nr:hypothetical protein [Actinomycetota bacterium]
MSRKRSLTAWVRILHRWISMLFVVVAAALIVPGAFGVDTTTSPLGLVALLMLVLLAVSGVWTAVHHYAVKLRHPRRRSGVPAAPVG